MDKQEKIVCAAVKFEQPVPGSSECIVIGIDYKDCESKDRFYELKANDDFLNLKWKKTSGYQKGFITSKNRFVDAKEAMEIAVDNIQVKELFDLWIEFNENDLLFDRVTIDDFEESKDKYFDKIDELLTRDLKPEDLY